MKNKDQTKAQLADELAETSEQTAGLKESETERKQATWFSGIERWLPTASMFVLLCVLVCLNEILDLPRLLLGAPATPLNWQETIIEMTVIAVVGFLTVSRLIHDITGRKRAEEALRETHDYLDKLIQYANAPIIVWNPDMRITRFNHAFEHLTGYTAAEVIGQELRILFPEASRDESLSKIERALSGEYWESVEIPIVRRDGDVRLALWNSANIYAEDGTTLLTTIAQGQDITERKRAEEALRESKQWLAATLRSIGDAMIATDARGLVTLMNPVAENLTGWNEAEAMGQPLENIFNIINEQTGERVENPVARVLREGVVVGLANQTVLIAKDGTKRPIADSGSPMRDEKGNIIGTVMIFRDVTERRRAEEALRQSESRYRGLFENVPISLWEEDFSAIKAYIDELRDQGVTDLRAYFEQHPETVAQCAVLVKILDVNKTTLEWFQADSKEALSSNLNRVFGPESYPVFKEELIALAKGRHSFSIDIINRTLAGDDVHVNLNLSIAPGAEDTWSKVLVALTNITERKQAQEALQRYTERLRTLRAIDSAILATWSPEEVAQVALCNIRQLVPCQHASVVMFDLESQEGTVLTAHVNGETGMGAGMRFSLDASTIAELRQGKVRVVEDILALWAEPQDEVLSQPPPVARALQAEGIRSYVTMPLIAQGELIGSLNLGADSPGAFTPEHVDIVREVADQVAVGLHQARLRAALEAEEQRLEALVEHLPEGVLLLDGERRILLSNPIAQIYLPVLTDAAVGDVLTLIADRPIEKVLEAPPVELWHELEIPGPPRRVFEAVARPVATGLEAEGWVLVIRDVTQEREMQRRVQRQERLAAVGQLAGGIAHDFNNLLTTIMLYAQMPLSKPDLPPNAIRSFEIILDESRRAAELVQQILDFSRRSPIDTSPMDLGLFVQKTLRVLERTIPENINLRFAAGPEEYVVNADPTRIQQVLMNLATNGRDSMPEGGGMRFELSRVQVQPGEEPPVAEMDSGEWVCLAVSDTGTGIPPDALARIFEPFFTTKEVGKGT
ncbi:MAG: PAS domain S-box protein, partial [Chloroflexi bacterium]|nr:PAS domain S-box protein [Chloroflexota bacterium]